MNNLEVKFRYRFNPWKCTKNQFEIIKENNCIFMPYYTSCRKILECMSIRNGKIIKSRINLKKKDRENFFDNMEIDDYIIIFENGNRNNALLVKIKSDCKIKIFDNINIYRNENINNSFGDDVIEVSDSKYKCTKEFTEQETMWAIVRDIDIIKEINSEESIFKAYDGFQGTCIKNKLEERFIEV